MSDRSHGMSLSVGAPALYVGALATGFTVPDLPCLAVAALTLGQLVLVLAARSPTEPFWKVRMRGNRVLWPVLEPTFLSLILVLYIPPFAATLTLAPVTFLEGLVILGLISLTTLWLEPTKWHMNR